MVTFHKTLAAAFVAAVGLAVPVTATPLPYTTETSCRVTFADGSTSSECDGVKAWASTSFDGEDGGNAVGGFANVSASAGYVDIYGPPGPLVMSSRATSIVSFMGITPGPIRGGMADIWIDAVTPNGVIPWGQDFVSLVGFPEFDCKPLPGDAGCQAEDVPFTLGVPFGFKITAGAEATCCPPPFQANILVVSVGITIKDAAGNPVPIHAASADRGVPEPAGLASVGLALIGAAYLIRRRAKA